ncbi:MULTISPECIES: pyrroloquinoline quinone biosynthesis protein PqqE [unclassified Pseudomonas]|uniref:pyrroloquinoline quinone biosynthesis protein PqqE n=1 Tax=unclassified Pseudomonas TaxID=196821 RepID=UPI0024475BDC|nr:MULTISPECIES: pyrroloquinoline quinone biosynthesis protein PqqE [unclassified Pseudomonas]MDG9925942.1 pyrroloquinoline quinone biosynthesis protein PqqE [Pseudomonas sp. GD04045]MDH0034846.1 pyrroloquinoline quinone biosynthesis protein PqqE [Pseudomonas sp. GD04019]
MQISGNAFSAGLSGIQAGQRRVDQAASEIASNTLPAQAPTQTSPPQQVEPNPEVRAATQPDLAESLVSLTQGRNEVQASARVVETADEVLGTLIDTRA